jgi:hypothetical protein
LVDGDTVFGVPDKTPASEKDSPAGRVGLVSTFDNGVVDGVYTVDIGSPTYAETVALPAKRPPNTKKVY